jgi:hypothetical protein
VGNIDHTNVCPRVVTSSLGLQYVDPHNYFALQPSGDLLPQGIPATSTCPAQEESLLNCTLQRQPSFDRLQAWTLEILYKDTVHFSHVSCSCCDVTESKVSRTYHQAYCCHESCIDLDVITWCLNKVFRDVVLTLLWVLPLLSQHRELDAMAEITDCAYNCQWSVTALVLKLQ